MTARRTPRIAWWILFVLGLVFALFAGDRAVLSILKTTLGKEVGLTNSAYSAMVTAFMVPYTVMYLFVGGWIDRLGAKLMLTLCVAMMSLATLISGLAQGVTQLVVARFVLGIAEAGVVPAITVAIFTWFASERRALAYSLANAVQSCAYILCPPFVAAVTLSLGWRWSFLIPGMTGVVVALLWWHANAIAGEPPPPEPVAAVPQASTYSPFRAVFALPAVRTLILARVICDPFWFFFQYWQTAFLQERLKMTLVRVGELTWIPPLVYIVTALALSAFSDRLIAGGWTAPKARLLLILSTTLLAPAAFFLPIVSTEAAAIVLITLTSVMCSTWLNMSSVLMGALVPRSHLGAAIGLMSALGGTTAIIFNAAAGPIIDHFGYTWPFWLGACLHPLAAGVLIWYFFGRRHVIPNTAVPA